MQRPIDASSEVLTTNSKQIEPVVDIARFLCEVHEAVYFEDHEKISKLETIGPDKLAKWLQLASSVHPNVEWLDEEVWSGWHFAFGRYERSIQHSESAWRNAHRDEENDHIAAIVARRAATANNLSAANRKLGINLRDIDAQTSKEKFYEAIKWAAVARELQSGNALRYMTESLAYYHSGDPERANELIGELSCVADFNNPKDLLAFVMKNERELQEMDELPQVQSLFDKMVDAQESV